MPLKPTSSSGSDPKLATEAKLCAYLEGTLPPDERVEIESYLQSNPQHRQLLKELRGTRELLQTLPAESAPPEIAEAFEQQLERSMLLDDLAIDPVPRSRGGPQKLLIAALVLLACGLAVVIYLALPGAATSNQRLTALTPSTPSTEPTEATSTPAPAAAATMPSIPRVTSPVPATSAPAVPPLADASSAEPPFEAARRLLRTQLLPPLPAELLTVRTNDPAAPRVIADAFRASVIPVQRLSDAAVVPASQPAATVSPTTQSTAGVAATPPVPPIASTSSSSPGGDAGDAFLARSLSLREATRLSMELATTYGVEAVNLYAPGTWNPAATNPSATAPTAITPDESLTVTVDQLIGPGVEKTNTVHVAADGTVMLPMLLEPIAAAGLSLADLQVRIADRYRDAHLISHATVTVVSGPVDTQPTAGANAPASTEAVAVPPPTTAPTADAEQPVNLLVLLLPAGNPAATRPASP